MGSFFLKNTHIAIIGDIKDSRKIANRSEVQSRLKMVLDGINHGYDDDIASKFIITLGDEFQGLLCEGSNTMKIISEIEMKMHPIRLRFGVGIGEITTEIDKEMALGENDVPIRLVNTILVLMTVIKDSWSDRQWEIIGDMFGHQDTQADAAKRLGIRQPAVQKSLASGKYYAYCDALDAIGEALEGIRRRDG